MLVRKIVHALLGLLSILALAVVLWAPLVPSLLRDFDMEMVGGTTGLRLYGAGAFVALLVLRVLVRPPRQASRREIAWGEFATAVGGTASVERRGLSKLGWTGGITVRWSARGIPVTLYTTTDHDRNMDTHFDAEVRMARPFQCHAVHQSMMTKVLFSPQLWNVALSAVKERESRAARNAGMAAITSPGVADQLAFLASKEILVGDPRIDDAFLIKTDTPDLAREFFVDAGVSCALHDLDAVCKGWQLSLLARGGASGGHQLTLVMSCPVDEQRELEACRALVEASLRCLADRGMLASTASKAA